MSVTRVRKAAVSAPCRRGYQAGALSVDQTSEHVATGERTNLVDGLAAIYTLGRHAAVEASRGRPLRNKAGKFFFL